MPLSKYFFLHIIDGTEKTDAFNEIVGKVDDKFANRERIVVQDTILLPSV